MHTVCPVFDYNYDCVDYRSLAWLARLRFLFLFLFLLLITRQSALLVCLGCKSHRLQLHTLQYIINNQKKVIADYKNYLQCEPRWQKWVMSSNHRQF